MRWRSCRLGPGLGQRAGRLRRPRAPSTLNRPSTDARADRSDPATNPLLVTSSAPAVVDIDTDGTQCPDSDEIAQTRHIGRGWRTRHPASEAPGAPPSLLHRLRPPLDLGKRSLSGAQLLLGPGLLAVF